LIEDGEKTVVEWNERLRSERGYAFQGAESAVIITTGEARKLNETLTIMVGMPSKCFLFNLETKDLVERGAKHGKRFSLFRRHGMSLIFSLVRERTLKDAGKTIEYTTRGTLKK
jgi:hypothetical protein